jgi:hypothetical protein
MVSEVVSAPDALVVNPTVYVAGAPATWGDTEAVTPVTTEADAPGVITMNDAPSATMVPKAIL